MFNKNRALFTCELMIGFYFIDLITFVFLLLLHSEVLVSAFTEVLKHRLFSVSDKSIVSIRSNPFNQQTC